MRRILQLLSTSGLILSSSIALAQNNSALIFTDEVVSYSPDLSCYNCIQNDYIYCLSGQDHEQVAKGASPPAGHCCASYKDCPQVGDSNWTCSSDYNDKLLSLRMCPFRKDRCGDSSDIILSKTGDHKSMSLNLYPGDICFFTMRAECGLPAFEPTGTGVDGIEIFTIEYDDEDVETDNTTVSGSTASKPKNIPIPKKNTPLSAAQIANDYYDVDYYFYSYLPDGSYMSAWMSGEGTFEVKYQNLTEYYSAYGCYDKEYFQNKYQNPYYGYQFKIDNGSADNSTFVVVFTNGIDKLYPYPNSTVQYFNDGSSIITDSEGHSFYNPPNHNDFWYDPNQGNNSTNSSDDSYWYPKNLNVTQYNDSECNYTRTLYIDQSQSENLAAYCVNGSYIYYPSEWTNNTYWAYNYTGDNWEQYTMYQTWYIYNESILFYEYYQNGSYFAQYRDGSIYQSIEDYDKTTTEWLDGFCKWTEYTYYDYLKIAQCNNGSTLYLPPFIWQMPEYPEGKPVLLFGSPSGNTSQSNESASDNSTSNQTQANDTEGNYTTYNFSSWESEVHHYELFENSSYIVHYYNFTGIFFDVPTAADLVGDNKTAWYSPDGFEGMDLWSPKYWNSAKRNSSYGLFWNNTAWELGKWGLFDQEEYDNFTWDYRNQSNYNWYDNGSDYYYGNGTYDNNYTDSNGSYYGNDSYWWNETEYNNTYYGNATDYNNSYYWNDTNYNNSYNDTPYYNNTPAYNYIDKSGPKQKPYDKTQGGLKKYKEDNQDDDAAGHKSDPQEPLCKGRNQMIIMGDPRVYAKVYQHLNITPKADNITNATDNSNNTRRVLYVSETSSSPNTVSLKMETVNFIPDNLASTSSAVNIAFCFVSLFAMFALTLF